MVQAEGGRSGTTCSLTVSLNVLGFQRTAAAALPGMGLWAAGCQLSPGSGWSLHGDGYSAVKR